jgi:quinol monooxygenase YgiN
VCFPLRYSKFGYLIERLLRADHGGTDLTSEISWVLQVAPKPGKLDEFTSLMGEMVESTSNEPGAVAYEWFVSDDGSHIYFYERYADSDAALAHRGAFGENFAERFLGAVDPAGFTVYGSPSDALREGLAALGPTYLGPFGGFPHRTSGG